MEFQSEDGAPLIKCLQAGRQGATGFSGLDGDKTQAKSDDHVVPVHRAARRPSLTRGELGNYSGLQ
jgi:hypothetical protein